MNRGTFGVGLRWADNAQPRRPTARAAGAPRGTPRERDDAERPLPARRAISCPPLCVPVPRERERERPCKGLSSPRPLAQLPPLRPLRAGENGPTRFDYFRLVMHALSLARAFEGAERASSHFRACGGIGVASKVYINSTRSLRPFLSFGMRVCGRERERTR